MKRNTRKLVKNVGVKIRELPSDAMKQVEELINSATPARQETKELEHGER